MDLETVNLSIQRDAGEMNLLPVHVFVILCNKILTSLQM